jgi:hypothetical protein
VDRRKLANELRGKYEAGATVRALVEEYEERSYSYGTIHRLLTEVDTPMRPSGGDMRTAGHA